MSTKTLVAGADQADSIDAPRSLDDPAMMIQTRRLRLRSWLERDRDAFAAMHADPDVMIDAPDVLSRDESDTKFDRYVAGFEQHGFGRWCVETLDGLFVGYTGVMRARGGHPLGPPDEIGWRLTRNSWGFGHATEAALASLDDVFRRIGLAEVLAYTAPDNARSQAVMARLSLRRDPARDFAAEYEGIGTWRGLVWVACPAK